MPCRRASAQVIRPLPLSSHRFKADSLACSTFTGFELTGIPVTPSSQVTTMVVNAQFDRILSTACASAWSIVKPYLRLTSSVRFTYQQALRSGVHCAISFARFWCLFTPGLANVRFNRSRAKALRVAISAAHSPLSCASERATICSISV